MDDPRLSALLEEAIDSSRTPEEICARAPELTDQLRRRLERYKAFDNELEALFPEQNGQDVLRSNRDDGTFPLPMIPGYDLHSILGRGGMGIVYLARHRTLKRLVAVKMTLSGIFVSKQERARFQREAESLAAIHHPHIVQIYDVGSLDGRPYFTMEFLEGGSLARKLKGTPLAAEEAASIVTTLAAAMSAAHAKAIIHRDLKPANILLTGDGIPKISDFGLAADTSGLQDITLSGVRIGTPSYMAPEQASGGSGQVSAASDIYSLGAILYETLTGRPPFRGESAAETERQLVEKEPVSPSRLNATVPRDLETICLKCLMKEPTRRYETAEALVEDLRRFQSGEPISARRVGRVEKSIKWVRRRRAVAALWVAGSILAVTLASVAVALFVERATTTRVVKDSLDLAAKKERESLWQEANSALTRAELRLDGRDLGGLRRQLIRAKEEAAIVPRLESIRALRACSTGGDLGHEKARQDYAETFRAFGIGAFGDDPNLVAERIISLNVRTALVAAIYDWINCYPGPDQVAWLVAVAKYADPTPAGWLERALDISQLQNRPAQQMMELDPSLAGQSVELLLVVAQRMGDAGVDTVPFLKAVQKSHPSDFWANLALGRRYDLKGNFPEALRFYQAAVSLRPEIATGHNNIGNALASLNRREEASSEFIKALEIDPSATPARANLGVNLVAMGKFTEATPHLSEAIRQWPEEPLLYAALGDGLIASGKPLAAVEEYRKAVKIRPTMIALHEKLRASLARVGHLEELFSAWKDEIAANPRHPQAWSGYLEFNLFLGRTEQYHLAVQEILNQFSDCTEPRVCDVVGRACLLAPPSAASMKAASDLIERGLAIDSKKSTGYRQYFLVGKGLLEYRLGRYDSSIAILEGDAANVLSPMPGLVAAMARARLGQTELAERSLKRAILSFDWSMTRANSADAWMFHVLRREAETLISPNVPELLNGLSRPGEK